MYKFVREIEGGRREGISVRIGYFICTAYVLTKN